MTTTKLPEIELLAGVYQDGAQFYHEQIGLLKDYNIVYGVRVVRGDFDMEGAALARAMFLYDFPALARPTEHDVE